MITTRNGLMSMDFDCVCCECFFPALTTPLLTFYCSVAESLASRIVYVEHSDFSRSRLYNST